MQKLTDNCYISGIKGIECTGTFVKHDTEEI